MPGQKVNDITRRGGGVPPTSLSCRQKTISAILVARVTCVRSPPVALMSRWVSPALYHVRLGYPPRRKFLCVLRRAAWRPRGNTCVTNCSSVCERPLNLCSRKRILGSPRVALQLADATLSRPSPGLVQAHRRKLMLSLVLEACCSTPSLSAKACHTVTMSQTHPDTSPPAARAHDPPTVFIAARTARTARTPTK